ncbi:hypothetical protein KVV02_003203 [Mortierella alpina]|uniref:Methyltransferase domain-containing protein n=1 Tax=Mortierella alpina TaxID=64518 RepID=A0A9P8A3D6_MORAP|nr:hypothetical protein KVV02_003203 [Mortierella alpina]
MTATIRDIGRAATKPRFIAAFALAVLVGFTIFHRETLYGMGSKYNSSDNLDRLKSADGVVTRGETVADRLIRSEKLYQENLANREAFLKESGYGSSSWSPWGPRVKEMMPWWWYFQPAFNCPHELQRVGRFNDGGKWVCGLSLLGKEKERKCIIYSMGVFDDSSFEAALLGRTNCEVYAFDGSVDGIAGDAKGNPKIHFQKVFIGDSDRIDAQGSTWKTLPTIMKEYGHTWIDLLKVDIEGFEYQMMDDLMKSYTDVLPFSQLQIEFHLNGQDMHGDASFPKFKTWFENLEKHHLRPFMNELNLVASVLYPGQFNWIEYSFINIAGDHNLLHN